MQSRGSPGSLGGSACAGSGMTMILVAASQHQPALLARSSLLHPSPIEASPWRCWCAGDGGGPSEWLGALWGLGLYSTARVQQELYFGFDHVASPDGLHCTCVHTHTRTHTHSSVCMHRRYSFWPEALLSCRQPHLRPCFQDPYSWPSLTFSRSSLPTGH